MKPNIVSVVVVASNQHKKNIQSKRIMMMFLLIIAINIAAHLFDLRFSFVLKCVSLLLLLLYALYQLVAMRRTERATVVPL